jgi:cytochrome c peroxidase
MATVERGRCEMNGGRASYGLGGVLVAAAACSGGTGSQQEGEALRTTSEAITAPLPGKALFDNALPHTNGRACASCHVDVNHFTLTPSNVQARFAANPADPLFNPIDADDPTAATPAYDHLKLGLVRITLKLPDNMDLINADGSQIVTPPDRTFFVWRGVPTVENTFYTAPYQYDGRFPTYQIQAQEAIINHSQGPDEPQALLDLIAGFESTVYSSTRAAFVGAQVALGIPQGELVDPDAQDTSNGHAVYVKACAPCHGGAKANEINPYLLANGFNLFSRYVQTGGATVASGAGPVALKSDGNVAFEDVASPGDAGGSIIVSESNPQPADLFMNVGFAGVSSLEQEGFFLPLGPDGSNPDLLLNETVPLPRYRFRFYTDGTRTTQVTDLPPIPASTGYPCNGPLCGPVNPPFDSNGLPIVGPNFFMQQFSTDPGRAGITGNPADFEAFKVPQLRGIADTAPYMHDNSLATLSDVIDIYSRFILGPIAALNLPAVNLPEGANLPPEALSSQEKADLLTFLQTF